MAIEPSVPRGAQKIPIKDLSGKRISPEILKYIPEESAANYQFVPIGIKDGILEIGIVDPDNIEARNAVSFISDKLGLPFKFFLITPEDFKAVIEDYKNLSSEVSKALGELDAELSEEDKLPTELMKGLSVSSSDDVQLVEDAPITKIVAVIIRHATDGNASDIHIEPTDGRLRVRFRVDGALYTSLFLPASVHDAVVARIKIICNMKLDEKRKPQDGRFSAPIDGRRVDFRVSSFPSYYGEKIVIRILDSEKGIKKIDELGLTPSHVGMIKKAISKPYGMILITGPTGSGKTTTLYAMLNEIDREKLNVISLEDPVEYSVSGVSQSQVRPEIGYDFANGLRSILRQDPDVIMVGEIRDKETAQLAVQAALTGHLVLSTLHTNNATGVIPRLIDMGVDPFLIGPTLILAMAQRLVRLICPESKEAVPIDASTKAMIESQTADLPEEFKKNFQTSDSIYHLKPSPTCPGGTRGRQAVFEMFEMDTDLEKMILKSPSDTDIYKHVRDKGMLTMREDALQKAFTGLIPFEEINNV
ncbi:MAG TPA: GspE/PulE family protein [Candidatus Paceibacterota bacterium]